MTGEPIQISPATRAILTELSGRTGRTAAELLDAAVAAFRQSLTGQAPITSIPGVNPTDVWESATEADAGRLAPHAEVFARLRDRH
jgi:predicted transcriptional regulator